MRRLVLKFVDNEASTEYAYDYGRIFSPAYQVTFQSLSQQWSSFADACCLSAVDNEDFLLTNKAAGSRRMLINIQEMRLSCREIYDVFLCFSLSLNLAQHKF